MENQGYQVRCRTKNSKLDVELRIPRLDIKLRLSILMANQDYQVRCKTKNIKNHRVRCRIKITYFDEESGLLTLTDN